MKAGGLQFPINETGCPYFHDLSRIVESLWCSFGDEVSCERKEQLEAICPGINNSAYVDGSTAKIVRNDGSSQKAPRSILTYQPHFTAYDGVPLEFDESSNVIASACSEPE